MPNDMASLVNEFVARLGEHTQRVIADAFGAALSHGAVTNGYMPNRPLPPRSAAEAVTVHEPKAPRAPRAPRVPVDDAAVTELETRFHAFVAAHPGERIETINKELGTDTKSLQTPIKRLLTAGSIRCEGQKRARIFFAA